MDNHASHAEQLSDRSSPTIPLSLESFSPLLDSMSNMEGDTSVVQSFDEDDMYDLDGLDSSNHEDNIAVPVSDSDDDLQEPSDNDIFTHLELLDDVQTPQVGLVCHQTLNSVWPFQFDDVIQEIRDLHTDLGHLSAIIRDMYGHWSDLSRYGLVQVCIFKQCSRLL